MRRMVSSGRWAAVAVWAMALLVGCSGEPELSFDGSSTDGSVAVTAAPSEATTTASTVAGPTTTLSQREQRVQEREAALAEIERVVEAWWTYPFDSSKGTDGIPAEYMTGVLLDRYVANAEYDVENGQIQRSRGGPRLRVLDIELDFDEGSAEVHLCLQGDHEIVDAETGEVTAANDGIPGEGTVFVESTASGWKLNEFFWSKAGEIIVCEIDG